LTKCLYFAILLQIIKIKRSFQKMSIEQMPTTSSSPEAANEIKSSPYDGIFQETLSESDEKFIARPIYQIEGSADRIIFINPNEHVDTGHLSEVEVSLVEAKPAGILKKAIELHPEDSKLKEILTNIESQEYGDEELLLLDEIAASVAIDEQGQFAHYAQTEGFALILAALSGNQEARDKVDSKLEAYYKLNKERQESEKQSVLNSERNEYYKDVEPITWGEVAFVHSTKFDIDRDETGSVILRPHAHHTENTDKPYPRATLHFTTNAEVENHLFGSWSKSNRLIVTNGQNLVDANGLPAKMNTIDTYWSINPGQPLKLEGASVVEPRSDLDTLFKDDKDNHTVSYLDKQEYTDKERLEILKIREIATLDRIYDNPVDREDALKRFLDYLTLENTFIAENAEKLKGNESAILRRMALQAAMKQQGVTTGPLRLEQWSTNSQSFDRSFVALSLQLGIPYGIHSDSEENILENRKFYSGEDRLYPSNSLRFGRLEAQRTVVALGQISTKLINTAPETDSGI
jgi:hypothetical protein